MPEKSKEESDSATKRENCIIDLFNENDTEEPSQERSNLNSAERSSEYQYCSDVLSSSEEAGGWFDAVCNRDTCRIGTTMQSHAPTPSSVPSSSSSSSSSSSPVIHFKSSLSSFDAVFNPMPMPLYNSPDEILDWADWLATVCVSSEDRKHIDLCVGGLISMPDKNAINIRDGVMRGIQIRERERERERERNIRESILRENKKKIESKKFSEVLIVDEDEEEEDDDDNDDDDDAEDIEGVDNDEDDEDESEENDEEEEEEEEEEEDEDYAWRRRRTPDALPSRSSSRKRKAVFD
jgi:hypothetical protein